MRRLIALRHEGARPVRLLEKYGLPAALLVVLAFSSACGYRTTPKGSAFPQLQVLAIPTFTNTTQTYRIEQMLTAAVVREFTTRSKYRILHEESGDADATLRGVVLTTQTVPVTYDSVTGRASSALVTVSMRVTLVDKDGTVLFENPNWVFREEYQISSQVSSFFGEETPALHRLSRDFARSLVSTVLEGF